MTNSVDSINKHGEAKGVQQPDLRVRIFLGYRSQPFALPHFRAIKGGGVNMHVYYAICVCFIYLLCIQLYI